MSRERIMTVVGTRPEIIRLSRTIARLDEHFDQCLVHTGQNHDHRLNGMLFDDLGLRTPDRDLGVDTLTLGRVLAGTLVGVEEAITEFRPHALLVLGDTNSSIAAVIAKRMRIPTYHMEAGNRCFDENVPEEVNRRLVDHVADFNLVYTEHARRNLLAEGLPTRRIALTGSPMAEVIDHYRPQIEASTACHDIGVVPGEFLLVSAHREENVDDPDRLERLVDTLVEVHKTFGFPVLVSTHPRMRKRLDAAGIGEPDGILFQSPFGFLDYVHLQTQAFCVLSDSGTIAEESAILGFPAVTLRDAIERPEALESASLISTGLDHDSVCAGVRVVVDTYRRGERPEPPEAYAIKNCSQRVVAFIRSTVRVHHAWAGVRRRPEGWDIEGIAHL
jgi:UDP-N-acetylglucosamine 2-epimerase